MATVKVNEATARARAGRPPGSGKISPDKLHEANHFDKPDKKPPEKSHVASKATKAALTVAAPEARAATTVKSAGFRTARRPAARRTPPARILPGTDRENVTHRTRIGPRVDHRTSSAGNHAPVILAEYILAMLIIVIKTITDTAKTNYQSAMALAMLQASALTGVFFVLFLLASGKRASKVSAWFGALVDLGVLFTAVNAGAITDFTSLVQGHGLPSGVTTLSVSHPAEFYSTQQDWTESAPASTPGNPGGVASTTPAQQAANAGVGGTNAGGELAA